jgi:hypothetical protein
LSLSATWPAALSCTAAGSCPGSCVAQARLNAWLRRCPALSFAAMHTLVQAWSTTSCVAERKIPGAPGILASTVRSRRRFSAYAGAKRSSQPTRGRSTPSCRVQAR